MDILQLNFYILDVGVSDDSHGLGCKQTYIIEHGMWIKHDFWLSWVVIFSV